MLREFIDTLLMLAEVYMSLFIAFPLILLLLLAIMSFMGGGTVAGFTPEMLIIDYNLRGGTCLQHTVSCHVKPDYA